MWRATFKHGNEEEMDRLFVLLEREAVVAAVWVCGKEVLDRDFGFGWWWWWV